ncbi:hypothetical protein K505DRAFT_35491 [Melanomma pulvis-pyrius CBS 109.77]|uniref:histidine kinase n=1 Tax=Melanomma pulvis-pyrius CBS 109.77 TaxID=1314802 RepID=A0A6A6XCA8_9PLEO|nr:hypothetical protein K505DRAFT_35491 [Melanomma pulvis-pyrius CBS 109.77]
MPNTIPIPRPPRANVSESKRDRDLFRLYGAAFRDIVHRDHTSVLGGHVPAAAKDSALVAYAQLAAIRLGASRALISLIDADCQHVLAEATPTTSLRGGRRDDLWLGNVSYPRQLLVCDKVLAIDPTRITTSEDAAVVIKDVAQSEYADRPYVKDGIMRFYAGVALTSPRGAIVGALCIIDTNPRAVMPRDDILYLQDLAATVMEHLDTYTLKDQQSRGEQLTRGLISFAEGASTLQPYHDDHRARPNPQPFLHRSTFAALQRGQASQDAPALSLSDMYDLPLSAATPREAAPVAQDQGALPGKPEAGSSINALQESILPANSKAMFARAANIMRASSDLDGVLILDASVAAAGHQQPGNESESSYDSRSGEEEGLHWFPGWTHSPSTQSSVSTRAEQRCQILGFSTRNTSSVAENIWALGNRSLLEGDLRRMLTLFPMGNIIHFTADGEVISSSDDSESSTGTIGPGSRSSSRQRRKRGNDRSQKIMSALQATFPGARSIAFVPFWDFERSRWFAGCLCWTNEPDRLLSPKLDLLFFKVFGHSVMNELSRLDTIASDQVKTTFVSLISHELRSPLHGILGSIQFLQDSLLDSFQVTMLNSMAACGQTLLDTIDHVLDYSKVNEPSQNVSSKRLKGTKTICLSSKPLKTQRPTITASPHPAIDLGLATEEVVEAVFAGQSYQAISDILDDGVISPQESRNTDHDSSFFQIPVKRKSCFIVLDVQDQDWSFCLPIGAWRRILMNIFGNALKFTESGHIKVSLRANWSKGPEKFTYVTVSVGDTGPGMSQEFLANKLFQPFTQENPHANGTGLGLSIVRQIIENIGGKVEVTSNISEGTQVVVKLALPRPQIPQIDSPQRIAFLSVLPRLRGRKICILHQISPKTPDERSTHNASELFTATLGTTLTRPLNMEVIHTTEWTGHNADIVICPEPSFDYLAAIRNTQKLSGRAPVTIFVATDGLEAATLRSDARILSKESVVEIITQPCGPYKLANILSHCLNRYEVLDENSRHQSPAPSNPSRRASSLTGITIPLHSSPTKTPSTETAEFPLDSIHLLDCVPLSSSVLLSDPVLAPDSIFSPISALPPDSLIPPHCLLPPDYILLPDILVPSSSIEPDNKLDSIISIDTITPWLHEDKLESSYVLITDDNPINRRLLVAFMNKRKIRYQEAENGLEAVKAYQEGKVRFDIILMDISMPVMDGMTATRLIREHESRYHIKPTHIIALTGLVSASARLEAWSSGVDCYMTKPVDFRKLDRMLHVQTKAMKK